MLDVIMNIFVVFLTTCAIVLYFVVIPGIVVFVVGVLIGTLAAIPIVAVATLTRLAPHEDPADPRANTPPP